MGLAEATFRFPVVVALKLMAARRARLGIDGPTPASLAYGEERSRVEALLRERYHVLPTPTTPSKA